MYVTLTVVVAGYELRVICVEPGVHVKVIFAGGLNVSDGVSFGA